MSSVCGLEGHAPEGDGLAGEPALTLEVALDLLEEPLALALVHIVHRLRELRVHAAVVAHHDAGERVLGEARAAVAEAGVQELIADAAVRAHALAHPIDVRAVGLAEVGHLVDEADLRREEVCSRRT